jgi:hypothetical protein
LLLAFGGVLLVRNLGFEIPVSISRLWPVLLLALGGARMLLGSSDGRRGGYWILLAGVYCGVSAWHVAGLEWKAAWPLFLVGAGLWAVIEGLTWGVGKRKEVGHDLP